MSIETLEFCEKLNEFRVDDNMKDVSGNVNTEVCHKSNRNLVNTLKNEDQMNDEKKKNRNYDADTTIADEMPNKKKKKDFEPPKLQEDNRDIFCWRCHKYVGAGDVLPCYFCPRVFHLKCVQIQEKPTNFWLCTECDVISSAENPDKISPALSKLQKKDLAELLMFVIKRMRQHEGSSHFENPVDPDSYPDYKDYIVKPMYLSLLEYNVKNLKYASCESFLADTKWMVHNSYIFNTVHSELTLYAKAMMKNAKHECDEIINCPDCYLHANTLGEDKWFIEPCEKPHILVWARLKGFPYWPCKVMKSHATTVDVRFFGDHNKSLVPVDCCYLYSKQMPSKQKKVDELEIAIKEASNHIKRLEEKFHVFQYAPPKILYNPKEEEEQRKLLLPYLDKPFYIKVKDKDKLFDPNIIGDIFEDHSLNHNSVCETDVKLKRKLESSSDFDFPCKKKHFNNQNEDIFFKNSSNISAMPLPSLNKPTIIIEESDADLLSPVGSFATSRQHNVGGYGKLNSLYPVNKSCTLTEKAELNNLLETEENHVTGISKPENLSQNIVPKSSNFFKENNAMKLPEKMLRPVNFFKQIDLCPEKKKKININANLSPSNEINVIQSNGQSSDTSNNNNQAPDKLRISSNAKLISVLNENPSLVDDYIFKPMVVIQKLKDDVLCDYSNYLHQSKISELSKSPLSNENKTNYTSKSRSLSYDLLNGNISDFFSVTEIDLENDDSFSVKFNKEMGRTDDMDYEENNADSPVDFFLKTEPIDPDNNGEELSDEEVDRNYIERLSKSILESTLDCQNEKSETEKQILSCSAAEDEFLEIPSSPDSDLQLIENAPVKNSAPTVFPSIEKVILPENFVEKKIVFSKRENGGAFKIIDDNNSLESVALNLKKDGMSKQFRLGTNVNDFNIVIDSYEKCVNKHQSHKKPISCLVKEPENAVNEMSSSIIKEVSDTTKSDATTRSSDQGNLLRRNFDNLNVIDHGKQAVTESVMHNEDVIVNDKKKMADSDCEIVNVIFSDISSKIKPVSFKTVKVPGRSLKMPIQTHMILSNSEKKQNHCSFVNKTDVSNLSSKSTQGIKFVNLQNSGLGNNSSISYPNKHQKTCDMANDNVIGPNYNNEVEESEGVQEEEKLANMEIDNILSKVEKIDSKANMLQVLKDELQKFEEHCKKKIQNYKRTYIEEMDSLYNMEKERWIQESMNVSENESKMMIDEIKKKQWCILCLNEANFHCCWSTSYCSEKCQLADWPVHMKTCTQYSMRIDDPNVNLSPQLKEIFQRVPEAVNGMQIKDVVDLISNQQLNNGAESCFSPNNLTSATSFDPSHSIKHTFTKSISNVLERKLDHLKDLSQRNLGLPENHLMNTCPNQTVYVSGKASQTNQTNNIIHVPVQNYVKTIIEHQDQRAGNVDTSKSFLVPVPLSNNRNTAFVSTVNATSGTNNISGRNYINNNHSTIAEGNQFVMAKRVIPTKVMKKTVPILSSMFSSKNVGNVQDDRKDFIKPGKPLFITLSNASSGDTAVQFSPKHSNNHEVFTIKGPSRIIRKSFEQTSIENRDLMKSGQSYLIIGKNGDSSPYTSTNNIGFQDVKIPNILPSST